MEPHVFKDNYHPMRGKQEKVTCPNCKGKGHIYSGGFNIFLWLVALFEFNNPEGITRDRCDTCKGKGFRRES